MKFSFQTAEKQKKVNQITEVNVAVPKDAIMKQQMKGEVENNPVTFPKDLGEEHPFDSSVTEGLYKNYGIVTGAVDKYVDFIVGPGFYVKSENKQAETIIQQWMQDVQFDSALRAWVKEGLVKISGYLELGGNPNETIKGIKILDAKSMYVVRDKKGKILKYNQFRGDLRRFSRDSKKVIPFTPNQIAQIKFNNIGDDAYGQGVVYPISGSINQLIGLETNMSILMKRKANAPIHAKIGDADNPVTPDAITDFGAKLEWLNNKHEWATDHLVDMKVIDFGKLGDKFDFPLQYTLDQIYAGLQIPKILVGDDVNLAVAPVQMDAFERRIQSIQSEVEKVIETKIFKRILLANGIQGHVEFEWGQPSNAEKNEKIKQITELLKVPTLSPEMSEQLQLELANLMKVNVKAVTPANVSKEQVDETAQPRVPGQNNQPQNQKIEMKVSDEELIESQKRIYEENAESNYSEIENDPFRPEATLREWLDFDFQVYLAAIIQAVKEDNFELLAAKTRKEINQGKFSKKQIKELKSVLTDAFKEGKRIIDIQEDLKDKVKIKDLVNEEGKTIVKAVNRTLLIARTETTRLSALGAQKHFKAGGVQQYQWVSTMDSRTSDICQNLHGRVFAIGQGPLPPAHINCRSTIVPVVEDQQ